MHIWGKGRAAGRVGSGRVRFFVGNRGSGRVNVSPGRVGSGPRKVTRGQLWSVTTSSTSSLPTAINQEIRSFVIWAGVLRLMQAFDHTAILLFYSYYGYQQNGSAWLTLARALITAWSSSHLMLIIVITTNVQRCSIEQKYKTPLIYSFIHLFIYFIKYT